MPFHSIPFLNAAPRKKGGTVRQQLPFVAGRLLGLPQSVEALIVTSDLQGVAPLQKTTGKTGLLGLRLVEELQNLAAQGKIPDLSRIGAILAGDLYSAPGGDVRGASGDVREVWEAFSQHFKWVVGVAGNHDHFGTADERDALLNRQNLSLLDGSVVERDGIRLGGVSYIIGNPHRNGRRLQTEFLFSLEFILKQRPDVLILHEGPDGGEGQHGNKLVREKILESPPALVVCGHCHWDDPLAAFGRSQILNSDTWVVVLTRE